MPYLHLQICSLPGRNSVHCSNKNQFLYPVPASWPSFRHSASSGTSLVLMVVFRVMLFLQIGRNPFNSVLAVYHILKTFGRPALPAKHHAYTVNLVCQIISDFVRCCGRHMTFYFYMD